VTLSAGAVDDGAAFVIVDDGPGIEPENLERIFNPFFTTRPEGTGLGLAIVHRIVEAHAGRVRVQSRKGEGTTFTVWIPKAR
jgi:signal transduction histidine kinase